MPIKLKNNAFGFLASEINASTTTLGLQAGNGGAFPVLATGDYFYATIQSPLGYSEIVRVTARSGDILTVVRGAESTVPIGFDAGARVELRITAASVMDLFKPSGFIYVDSLVGDGVTDDTAAFQAVINNAAEGSVIVLDGTKQYFIRNSVSTKRLLIDARGARFTAQPSDSSGGGLPWLRFSGSVGAVRSINTANESALSVTLTTASEAADFNAGDWVYVGDSEVIPAWDGSVGWTGTAELTRVSSVSSGVVTLSKPIEKTYSASNAAYIQKVNLLGTSGIINIGRLVEINPPVAAPSRGTNAPHIIQFLHCHTPVARNNNIDALQLHGFSCVGCVDPLIECNYVGNGFRPTVGGHAYHTRLDKCSGGIVQYNRAFKLRHTVDFVATLDGFSANNYTSENISHAYYCHGLYERRCMSVDDYVTNSSAGAGGGWAGGNPDFGPSFDFKVIRPKARCQTNGGISWVCTADGLYVEDPDIVIYGEGRAFTVNSGAKNFRVSGGKVDVSKCSATSTRAVLVRDTYAAGDAFGIMCENIKLENTEYVGCIGTNGAQICEVRAAGDIDILNNKFVSNNTGDAVYVSNSGFVTSGVISALRASNNRFVGTASTAIEVVGTPTSVYQVMNNAISGTYTGQRLIIPDSTILNRFANGDGIFKMTSFGVSTVSTAPNSGSVGATVYDVFGAQSSIDIVVRPKGNGALLGAVPDNTPVGGNKRGNFSIDLQLLRSLATQVASGYASCLIAGDSNTASGNRSMCIAGQDNLATGLESLCIGGAGNLASGAGSVNLGGNNNITDGDYSSAVSGRRGHTRGRYCGWVQGCESGSSGRAQMAGMALAGTSTDNTPVLLTANVSVAADAANQFFMASNTLVMLTVNITARSTSNPKSKGWVIHVLVENRAGTIGIVDTPTVAFAKGTVGTSAWDATVGVDNTLKVITITGTGENSENIRWTAVVVGAETA